MPETLFSRTTALAGLAAAGLTFGLAAGTASAQSIRVGQSINGELTGSDPRLSDGSHFDCYNLQTRTGEALQIDQTSGLFDSFLMVRRGGCDNPGAVIAEDDDGGGALNSRIVQQGDGALWAVIVNSLSANETGPYQLRVSAAGSGQAQSIPGQTAAAAQLPRVETEWGTQPEVCHAAYTAIVQLRAAGTAPEEYGNLRGMDYAARASRTGAGLTSDNRQLAETYTMNFRMMALVGALGFAPNGTPNGHRPLAEYLTVLGNCDRANGFAPVTAY